MLFMGAFTTPGVPPVPMRSVPAELRSALRRRSDAWRMPLLRGVGIPLPPRSRTRTWPPHASVPSMSSVLSPRRFRTAALPVPPPLVQVLPVAMFTVWADVGRLLGVQLLALNQPPFEGGATFQFETGGV